MQKKGKLELTWVGKYDEEKLEPRILVEDKTKSYGDPNTENMLIHGDNLLSLKALERDFADKIQCIFIDPPYNTGSAFEQYDDGVEHSIWLCMMHSRLEVMKTLLSHEGSIWISIDDNECHYLKVMCDEIFGRKNFLGTIIWEKSDSPRMDAKIFSSRHDSILVYAKDVNFVKIKKIIIEDETALKHYNKTDKAGKKYYLKPLRAIGPESTREARPTLYYGIIAPDGTEVFPKAPDGSDGRWRWSKERVERDIDNIEWINGKKGWSANYKIYAEANPTKPPETIWTHGECGSNRISKLEVRDFVIDGERPFDTPKPEKLIQRIISIGSDEGELVLDSFLGSATTSAVAHKMNRRWIGIELGEHCYTHCIPRLQKVIDGEQGGISQSVNWQGGGGFKFYELAEPLLVKNKVLPVYQLNPNYTFDMVAEAICKIEGFKYSPSGEFHGYSTENRFIHVTTEFVNSKYIMSLMKSLGENQSLLIYCTKMQSDMNIPDNVEVKKIPNDLLEKCDFESEVEL